MRDIEGSIARWQSAGVLDAAAADRIRAYEAEQKTPSGLRWEVLVALILGGLLLACGVVLFVSAHWDDLGRGARLTLVMAMVAVFHLAGAAVRERFQGLSTTLHAVGTVSTGAAIALVGQIFNIEEHWPAAVLMWAVAAFAGWALLRDQAQEVLALLLLPAWILSEVSFYTDRHIGQWPYIGRFLFVWGILYLTFFLASKRRATGGILFAVGAIAAVAGTPMMLYGWESWIAESPIPFSTCVWAWIGIAGVPLLVAAFKGHKGLIPPAAAVAFVIALPWCQRIWRESWTGADGVRQYYTRNQPNFASHALVAAFAVFLIWWGVRHASRALVNFGMVGFAITVCWFYFSDIFDKIGRSLGLIGLGILFLLGGWALEKMRRRLIAGMAAVQPEAL
ncbi:MAG TPA: DUF2157 domain-containing protein [Terracidiphilus sp.]|jgi:uncharacterized membrane protein